MKMGEKELIWVSISTAVDIHTPVACKHQCVVVRYVSSGAYIGKRIENSFGQIAFEIIIYLRNFQKGEFYIRLVLAFANNHTKSIWSYMGRNVVLYTIFLRTIYDFLPFQISNFKMIL